jgi:hypothetical protein
MTRYGERHGERWVWRLWQLVWIENEGDRCIVVDFIELAHGGEPGELVTLTLAIDEGQDAERVQELLSTLEAWAERDDGLCDAYRFESDAEDLTLVQGGTTLVLGGEGLMPS